MDWRGYTIELNDDAEGHRMQITGQWKPEKYKNHWWWKCLDCTESSGVLSNEDIIKLEARGVVAPPLDTDKDLSGNTSHPDESGKNDYPRYYDAY